MNPRILSFVVTVVTVAILLAARTANAECVADDGQVALTTTFDIQIKLPTGDGEFESNTAELDEFFNARNCECSNEPESEFQVELTLQGDELSDNDDVEVWVGTGCEDNENQGNCFQIGGEILGNQFDSGTVVLTIPTARMVDASTTTCPSVERTRTIFVLVDIDRDDDGPGDNDYDCQDTLAVTIDTQPPPTVEEAEAQAGEKSVEITWKFPEDNQTDFNSFQALCRTVSDGQPVTDSPSDADFSESCTDGDDAFNSQMFVCGTAAGTAESLRIDNLTNGVTYEVRLLAIDESGNFTAVGTWSDLMPSETTDFWELYQESGGTAEGGFCLVTSTYGNNHPFTQTLRNFRDRTLASSAIGLTLIKYYYAYVAPYGATLDKHTIVQVGAAIVLAPVVGLVALFEYTSPIAKLLCLLLLFLALLLPKACAILPFRPKTVAPLSTPQTHLGAALVALAVMLMGITLFPRDATAQSPYQPYWDRFDNISEKSAEQPPVANWNLGIKFGLYKPEIDKGNGVTGGPYREMFGGGKKLITVFELERFFLHPLGQLGVTSSIGFMRNSASSFGTNADGGSTGQRISGETTRFNMIPTSLGVVYRFTALDDRWRFPVVPYGKLSLSYYIWWITKPSGSVASVVDADGDRNRAKGASAGYQATVGIAIRAERIDPQAAASLRNELGIEHAGLFIEATYADVDGFGKNDKLRVGDLAYFAGFNFEF